MAREAEALTGAKDTKLREVTAVVRDLLRAGHHPIVFCRFIPTAEYVAEHFRATFRDVEVEAVTGLLPPSDRETRVARLGQAAQRVLVCTDCLSEGINLQDHFTAVVHYDLAWNPTRHEQREGRVDRYGQRRTVQMAMVYGRDNQIDGIVLDVLLRKHQRIRKALGISVPVPVNTNQVMEAIFEGLLLRGRDDAQMVIEEVLAPQQGALHVQWDSAADRQRRSRTVFAQETIKVEEVARELAEARAAVGLGGDVAGFVRDALSAHGADVRGDAILDVSLAGLPRGLRDVLPLPENAQRVRLGFERTVPEDVQPLVRTHPFVEGLASYVLQTALDPQLGGVARRAGVIRTRLIRTRTTALLVRFRYHLIRGGDETPLLAEDCDVVAFEGAPTEPRWLAGDATTTLLSAAPDGNVAGEQAQGFVRQVLEALPQLSATLDAAARERGQALLEAHRRVRQSTRQRIRDLRIEPVLPPDLLGIYVYLPTPRA